VFQVFMNSVRLFLQGKLFRDNADVFRQWLKGFGLTLAVFLVVAFTVNVLLGVIIASLVGGAAQPWLFKDLKYK
jgi:hypothetical protein